jgi:hypothetical protein
MILPTTRKWRDNWRFGPGSDYGFRDQRSVQAKNATLAFSNTVPYQNGPHESHCSIKMGMLTSRMNSVQSRLQLCDELHPPVLTKDEIGIDGFKPYLTGPQDTTKEHNVRAHL